MDARCQSIRDENYCQVFGNRQFFVEAYPIKKISDCHLGLDNFVKEYGAPDKITYDGEKITNQKKDRILKSDKKI